jgi:hypothetical protein
LEFTAVVVNKDGNVVGNVVVVTVVVIVVAGVVVNIPLKKGRGKCNFHDEYFITF